MNNKLGVKYTIGIKFATLLSDNNTCKVIMISPKEAKVIDSFVPINFFATKPKYGFSMWIKPLGSNSGFKRITQDEFINKYVITDKEWQNISANMKIPKNVVIARNRSFVVEFFKILSFINNNNHIMRLTEKHMNIDMIYGYNLTQDRFDKYLRGEI